MTFQQHFGIHGFFGSFAAFDDTQLVRHGFTTRTLHDGTIWDLNPKLEDPSVAVAGLTLLAEEIERDFQELVLSDQVHKDRIRKVTSSDWGFGLATKPEHKNVDALITNEPRLTLVTFYADCVPLFLLDPINKAIGLVHAGWKGTFLEIGKKTLAAMTQEYGSQTQDILVGIGPSIGPCCFEVGKEVADIMLSTHPHWRENMTPAPEDKQLVDLWQINKNQFLSAGVHRANIHCASLCTMCKDFRYHSYRRDGSSSGRMAAILSLI